MSAGSATGVAIQEEPTEATREAVVAGLRAFNRQHVPDPGWADLILAARSADGALKGGLVGETGHGWLHVDLLWVADGSRRQGLGTRLLAEAERVARARGCHHAHLDTFDFQAREFYLRLGWSQFGVLDDFPAGHRRFFLTRAL